MAHEREVGYVSVVDGKEEIGKIKDCLYIHVVTDVVY